MFIVGDETEIRVPENQIGFEEKIKEGFLGSTIIVRTMFGQLLDLHRWGYEVEVSKMADFLLILTGHLGLGSGKV